MGTSRRRADGDCRGEPGRRTVGLPGQAEGEGSVAIRIAARGALAGALAAGAAAAAGPAQGAVLPVFTVSEQLITHGVRPAPLVPAYVPPRMAAGGGVIQPGWAQGRVYSLRILHGGRGGTGIIALERCAPIGPARFGTCATLAATRRDFVRRGFRAAPARVRGRAGYLLTRPRSGGPERWLIWREDGLVHSLGSGTPKLVPLAQLRATATGLDRVQHRYVGGPADPQNGSGAVLVSTEGFVAGNVEWEGACAGPDARPRAGSMDLALVPRHGDAFQAAIAGEGAAGWTGTVSGVVGPAGIALEIRASGTFDGVACDTGALTMDLPILDRDVV